MKRCFPAWTALVVAMAVPIWLLGTSVSAQSKGAAGSGGSSSGGSSGGSGGGHASGGGGATSGGGGGHASSGGSSGGGGHVSGGSGGGGGRVSSGGSGGGGHISGGGAGRVSSGGGSSSAAPRGGAQRGPGSSTTGATARGAGETSGGNSAVPRGTESGTGNNVVPPYARPRNGQPSVGGAVPRSSIPQPNGGSIFLIPGYYGGGYYPWGFAGLGFAGGYGYYGGYYDPAFGDDPYYPQYQSGRDDSGGLKLKVKPSDASVYVDGYYVGLVNDFDGAFQKLTIEPGAHRVEIRAPGYETLQIDVRIEPSHTSTYRGELKKLRN
jgi:hypothetical protein